LPSFGSALQLHSMRRLLPASIFAAITAHVCCFHAESRSEGHVLLQIRKQKAVISAHSLSLHEPDMAIKVAVASSAAPAEEEVLEGTLISRIFLLCVIMYGGIAALWAINIKSGSPEAFRVGLLCISWASMSVGMHVLNKALVDYLHAPALITTLQMWLTVLVVGARSWGDLCRSPRGQVLQWLIVPFLFAGMLVSAFYAYAQISLTLLTLVRNLTPLLMLPLEMLVMPPERRPSVSGGVFLGILLMLGGAVIYSGGNAASISKVGLAFAFLNMLLAVTDRLMQRRLLTAECKDLSTGTCTILNNFFGALPTLMLAMSTGQLHDARVEQAQWLQPPVLVLLLLSGLVGTGISVLGIECQRAVSATSFSVMQNASKVAVVGAGALLFLDPIGSPASAMGLLLSLGGSFVYGLAQQRAAAQAKATDHEAPKQVAKPEPKMGGWRLPPKAG